MSAPHFRKDADRVQDKAWPDFDQFVVISCTSFHGLLHSPFVQRFFHNLVVAEPNLAVKVGKVEHVVDEGF